MTAARTTTAVIGLGISGLSCLRHLQGRDELVVIDSREAPPNQAVAKTEFPGARFYLGAASVDPARWEAVDRLVVSPGVAADAPLLQGSEALPRFSDIDLFVEAAAAPIIGITGTNGKSTVTELVGHTLRGLGANVAVGGNLGPPALSLLDAAVDAYVLELSSFQIEQARQLPLAAATVLNVSADHLDRHGSMAAYAAIKQQIYATADACVVNADDEHTAVGSAFGSAAQVSFGTSKNADWQLLNNARTLARGEQPFAQMSEFALQGRHNALNLLAAFALVDTASARLGLPGFADAPARYVAATVDFTGLEHRSEFVRELGGVRYVNDSKATNVGACVAALTGFKTGCGATARKPVVLLAGGLGKGADFKPLAEIAGATVKQALLFGEDAQLLAAALGGQTEIEHCPSLEQAVQRAQQLSVAGDTVLLAPACASMDMFDNFAHRGDVFRTLVMQLREVSA